MARDPVEDAALARTQIYNALRDVIPDDNALDLANAVSDLVDAKLSKHNADRQPEAGPPKVEPMKDRPQPDHKEDKRNLA